MTLFPTLCFAAAILHTFSVKRFQHWSRISHRRSILKHVFHLLGEVELVFGFWAVLFLGYLLIQRGVGTAADYLFSRNLNEPFFVFVIMTICSTRPVLELATTLIQFVSQILPLPSTISFYFSTLTLGPLLGSIITEPAAMTVTALILLERLYHQKISVKLMYATLGLLFVNVSIGGTLTPYSAPPVLMVASSWNWNLQFMLQYFGWKAIAATLLSTGWITFWHRNEFKKIRLSVQAHSKIKTPIWVTGIHLVILFFVVLQAHHPLALMGGFGFFLGIFYVTQKYQSSIRIREGLFVAFFLAGLVILGEPQRWWLEPLLTQMNSLQLYLGSICLTSITDNAALTYLGSQVPTLNEASRYALVAGSVVGGGLTVIANAPNPAGYGILNPAFGEEGISPLRLFLGALLPTLVAALCFWS